MIIAKYYRNCDPEKFLYGWCEIPEYIIQREWEALTNKNEKFIKDYFPSMMETIFSIPILTIHPSDLDRYRNIEIMRQNVNASKCYTSPVIQSSSSDVDILPADELIINNIREIFREILTHRIEFLFIRRFPNIFDSNNRYHNIFTINSSPASFTDAELLVRNVNNSKISTIYFSADISDMEVSEGKRLSGILRNRLYRLGHDISRIAGLTSKKNRMPINTDFNESSRYLYTNFNDLMNRDLGITINKNHFIPAIPIQYALADYTNVKFRVWVFKNGDLVNEKKGKVINFAFMEMMYKIFLEIEESTPTSRWSIIVSTLNEK